MPTPKFYICFDDSDHDPTYAPAGEAYLVKSEYEGEENPCSVDNASGWTSLQPAAGGKHTLASVLSLASVLGWEVAEDAEGQIILRTGAYKH